MKILLVEDDPVLTTGIQVLLETEGYSVLTASSLNKAFDIEASQAIDLVILDLGLSDGSGLDFLNQVRANGSRLPVIILTAQTDEDTVVNGLESGANDFVKKPFSNRELVARLRTALNVPRLRESQIRYGSLLLLLEKRSVHCNDRIVELNRREFDILHFLMNRAEAIVTREALLEHLGSDADIYDRTIDSHISHLRSRLKKQDVIDIKIKSVYGVGYRLEKV